MKKCKSLWEKEKSRKEATEKLEKVVAESKKVTDFIHARKSKSNKSGSKSNNATVLCSITSSDCIAKPN